MKPSALADIVAPSRISIDGRPFWRFIDGTVLPVVAGADGDPPTPPTPPAPQADPPNPPTRSSDPPPAPPTPAPPPDVKAAEKAARKAAEDAIAEQLGCSVAEAKEILAAKRAADDAEKTEAQRAEDEAKKAKADADAEKQAAANDRLLVRVERSLLAAGVPIPAADLKEGDKSLLERASVQVLAEVKADVDDDGLKTVVDKLKTDVPAFFTPAAPGAPDGVPGGQPAGGGTPAKTGVEAGRELARQEREKRGNAPKFMEGLNPLGQREAS